VPAFHRPAAASLLTASLLTAALLAATGCASFDAAFGKQEAVVQFQPQTSIRAMLTVRTACSHLPSAKPEALPKHLIAVTAGYEIRYLVTGASDADVARLEQCLGRFKSVAGVELTSPDGS
jgi:hypothetical protein